MMNKAEYNKKYHEDRPYLSHFYNARRRANNRNRFFSLSKEDVFLLWKSYNASNLKRPSLDRINNDMGYELANCQFIELIDNIKKNPSQLGRPLSKEHKKKIGDALRGKKFPNRIPWNKGKQLAKQHFKDHPEELE